MNGIKSYLLDTNSVLYLLSGKNKIKSATSNIYISIITELELLSYKFITEKENKLIKDFLNVVDIINIDDSIKKNTIELRKKYSLKLPDAIICSTALSNQLIFVTEDKKLYSLKEIETINLKQLIS